jgi:hypothetical protein
MNVSVLVFRNVALGEAIEEMMRGVEVCELAVFNDGRGDLVAIENGDPQQNQQEAA